MAVILSGIVPDLSDADFVTGLRAIAAAYLRSVDAWEAGYERYYRLSAPVVQTLEAYRPAFRLGSYRPR